MRSQTHGDTAFFKQRIQLGAASLNHIAGVKFVIDSEHLSEQGMDIFSVVFGNASEPMGIGDGQCLPIRHMMCDPGDISDGV